MALFQFALLARSLLLGSLFLSAEKDLEYVLGICSDLYDQICRYKQDALLLIFAPMMQCLANLAGQSASPTVLTGAFMNEEDAVHQATTNQHNVAFQQIHVGKMILATFVWDFDLARDQLRKFERLKEKSGLSPHMVVMELFYGGIASLSTNKPDVRKAKGNIVRLKSLDRHAPCLYASKICLLEAELVAVSGNAYDAMKKFITSIALSQRLLLVHDQALACERTFLFLRKEGRVTEGMYYIKEARSLYQSWGCGAKVRHLDDVLAAEQKQCHEAHASHSIRCEERIGKC